MNVALTFDIEIWCNGWDDLDNSFPASFDRYVYGRSRHGQYALPKTLEILVKNGLRGVFFVEPLFSARFGAEYLERVVRMIREAGQEVQLHLHPEWTDEITPPLLAGIKGKRQHLIYYDLEEQVQLIARARALLEAAGSGPVSAFRAGSFAANRNTYEALRRNGIGLDSSLNKCQEVSGRDLRDAHDLAFPFELNGVVSCPIAVFHDGLGRSRPAQVGACSFAEMREAIWSAHEHGWREFVVVSHNFEMLQTGSALPDRIVVARFEQLCAFLAAHRRELPLSGFAGVARPLPERAAASLPQVSLSATARRYAEQAIRRLH